MLNWFRKWREKRQEKTREERYRDGFSGAMLAYFVDEETTDYIVSFTEKAKRAGTYDLFDMGAEDAVAIIREIMKEDSNA